MSSVNPSDNLTPEELARLARLEATVQRGLRTYIEVGRAVGEIRDRHLYPSAYRSFDAYLRDRWGTSHPGHVLTPRDRAADGRPARTPPPTGPAPVCDVRCEALVKACEQTLRVLRAGEFPEVDIRLTVGKGRPTAAQADRRSADPKSVARLVGQELLPTLRWLLTQAAGTIADVAHQIETRAADVDDNARAQLADDLVTLDEELAALHRLLFGIIDWDANLERLLGGEIPPVEDDAAEDDD